MLQLWLAVPGFYTRLSRHLKNKAESGRYSRHLELQSRMSDYIRRFPVTVTVIIPELRQWIIRYLLLKNEVNLFTLKTTKLKLLL